MASAVIERPMDKQSQFLIIFGGFLGMILAILTARPKQMQDAILAVIASLFGAAFLAPACAETLTNFAAAYPSFAMLNAAPGTSNYMAIVGLGGMLGCQIVLTVKSDFIGWVKQFAKQRLKENDKRSIHRSEGAGSERTG